MNKPSSRDRTRALAQGGTTAAIEVLVAVGIVGLVAGTVYLNPRVDPVSLQDIGQVGP